jgi:hypothetical protein
MQYKKLQDEITQVKTVKDEKESEVVIKSDMDVRKMSCERHSDIHVF